MIGTKKALKKAVWLGVIGAGSLLGTAATLEAQRASPMDYARAEIAGHQIEVQYGRPSMRGREVFGGIVPTGQVWRTGANEATHLRTPVDLVIGEVRIAAGEYTLYSIPSEDGWTLIINRQTGQWGTAYDESQDLVRLPMEVETLADPVEQFTITLGVGEDSDGLLVLEWEQTRGSLAFNVSAE
jgi:hypothetical protein